jgi:hypothetical protein
MLLSAERTPEMQHRPAPKGRPAALLGVVTSVLPGEQNHGHYGQHNEQAYIDEDAAASSRGPHEQRQPENATSNHGPA